MFAIGVPRHLADPFPVTIECLKKRYSVFPGNRIQAPNSLFLHKERLFHRTVIAGKTDAASRCIVSAAEIGEFDCHSE